MPTTNVILVALSIIIFVGFLGKVLFRVTRVPDVIVLMVLGIILAQTNVLPQETLVSALPLISAIALTIILFDAGLNINIDELVSNAPRGILIAALGLTSSALIIGVIAAPLLDISLLLGMLLGTIIGGISSPLVIALLANTSQDDTATTTLRIESIVTDPLIIVVALALMRVATGSGSPTTLLREVIGSFSLSILIGAAAGIIWLLILRRLRRELDIGKFLYILTVGVLLLVYPVTEVLGGSGAVTAFVFGIVLAHGGKISQWIPGEQYIFNIPESTKQVNEQVSFFIKTFFFVTLGAIISFAKPVLFVYGLLFTVVLFLARVGVIQLSMINTGISTQQKRLMSFMLPRGLAAAIVASLPFSQYRLNNVAAFEPTASFPPIVFSVIIGSIIISSIGVSQFTGNGDGEEAELTEEGVEESTEEETVRIDEESVETVEDADAESAEDL